MNEDIELFKAKNKYLGDLFKEVDYKEFYRDIFPKGSFEKKGNFNENKGNGMAVSIGKKLNLNHLITDDLKELEQLVERDFVIMSPISYYGRARTSRMSTLFYGLAFDLDDVGLQELKELIHQTKTIEVNPIPTYIVNSGHGMHLYYIFKDPIKLYNHVKQPLKILKYALTDRLWNVNTSKLDKKQFQGIYQGFRMVGSPTKLGKKHRLTAFKVGDKIDIDYLNSFVPEDKQVKDLDYPSELTLEEAKEKYPEWYERVIIKGDTKQRYWRTNRALYDWWLEKVKNEAVFGHRYFAVMALAIYAKKSGVSYEELKEDAYALIPRLSALMQKEPFTAEDVESALKSYDENYITFPRKDIEKLTAISIPPNKRNGRTQKVHLERARAVQEIDYPNGEWREGNGRPSKEKLVTDFIKKNPEKNPTEIAKALEVSRTTVYKYLA